MPLSEIQRKEQMMSMYIDADAVNEVCPCGYCEGYDSCLKKIQVLPRIEIVRCKDCKFSESVITSWSTDGKNNVVERLCKVHKWSVKGDGFCSYGERSEE